ncbi:hypothetical protein SCLCIDRAFT_1042419 [Scleroderma citrinum Foug A]|uniref:Uncharacterized protein n=1 Tax=Scleroderma citrinum Foug A TaxID=1036808 RepID=A0A0C2ZAW6_9AGAM|nr:hypothetical protein SCLCIDRAFT_1042419 [Scleroderma citrinum Foug A]
MNSRKYVQNSDRLAVSVRLIDWEHGHLDGDPQGFSLLGSTCLRRNLSSKCSKNRGVLDTGGACQLNVIQPVTRTKFIWDGFISAPASLPGPSMFID